MLLHKLVLLFALLNIINAQENDKHMICKEINDIFSNQNHELYSRRQLQGPTGKRSQPGVKGEPGSPGARGQSGIVDYERIAELVRAEVEKKTLEMASEIQFLKRNQRNLTELIEQNMTGMEKRSQTLVNCESHGGVIVGLKCFVIKMYTSWDTTLSEADQICRNNGARLADISTEQEYDVIMENMRKKIPHGRSDVNVWTGMTRDKDGNAVLSNGQISPYKKILQASSQWTSATPRRTHVYFYVTRDANRDQGLGSIWPDHELQGSLCVIE